MNNFQALRTQIRAYLVFVILFENLLIIGGLWFVANHLNISSGMLALGAYGVSIIMTFIITFAATDYALQPLKAVWQIILHIAPNSHSVGPPNLEKLSVGRTLVTSLSREIYQIASVAEQFENSEEKSGDLQTARASFIINALPLPLFVLDDHETVTLANEAALKYIGKEHADVVNQNVYSVLDMSFPSENTFDSWLKTSKTNAVTASKNWERVRLNRPDAERVLQVDLAAYYNKGNTLGAETILTMFDHTGQYSQDDQAMSLVALAVHELRTPLTLLRGYIEVFDEELSGKVDAELIDFIHKMDASAQQLSAFINNMLNVARIEDDQLELNLQEENWRDILEGAIHDLGLRAKVRGLTLEYDIADNLPSVGADRLSIYEVVNNLVDNAIKYSGTSTKIVIKSALTQDGLIETTVQDFGVGVPASTMASLFNKFYRDHHNRSQVGGTGLGLYLSKAIITAHGGNIWVRSQEGKGSTFGFTILPYARLADTQKNGNNKDIVRGAHGWIKNHSLYRR